MSEPSPTNLPARIATVAEWLLVGGLTTVIAWTTICLGGARSETMAVSGPVLFGLGGLAALLFAFQRRSWSSIAWLPVPFLVFALGSVLWIAPAKWLAWVEWRLWLQMWLVFVLVLHFGRSRAQTRLIVGTFVLLGLTGVALAAWQKFQDPGWLPMGKRQFDQFIGRCGGMFGIPNSLAGFLELLIPVCLTLLWSRASALTTKLVCGWLAALFLFALVLSVIRGGMISLGLALALWPLAAGGEWRKKIIGAGAVLLAGAGVLVALYFASPLMRERFHPFLTGEFESSRPLIWRAAFQIWQTKPWFGTGAASYNVVFDQHRPKGFNLEPQWTHNDYLNTLSDYGVIGFALWFGAGAVLLWLGWRTVLRARQATSTTGDAFAGWRWRLGLWLGLVAFALHLTVDFHTKIPALACAAAAAAALLLREEKAINAPRFGGGRFARALFVCGACGCAVLAWRCYPAYRAEGMRFLWRTRLDKAVKKAIERDRTVPPALLALQESVKIHPENAQAWSDLSLTVALSWHVTRGNLAATGKHAEAAANEALKRCPLIAEFWVRKAVALGMQAQFAEAESSFKRAIELAPRNANWLYEYAFHLSQRPGREADARALVATCLTLDPANSEAVTLAARLNQTAR